MSLSAKKIINLEQSIKAYKFTAKDVAKCLGDCLHGGASLPVTKEELEDMYRVRFFPLFARARLASPLRVTPRPIIATSATRP